MTNSFCSCYTDSDRAGRPSMSVAVRAYSVSPIKYTVQFSWCHSLQEIYTSHVKNGSLCYPSGRPIHAHTNYESPAYFLLTTAFFAVLNFEVPAQSHRSQRHPLDNHVITEQWRKQWRCRLLLASGRSQRHITKRTTIIPFKNQMNQETSWKLTFPGIYDFSPPITVYYFWSMTNK